MMSTLSNQTACIPKLSGELINKNPWIWTKCGLKGWLKISEKGCVCVENQLAVWKKVFWSKPILFEIKLNL